MILELFIVLILIAFFFMWFGFKVQIRFFSVMGVLILLLLSLYVVFGSYTLHDSLQYNVGSVTNITTTNSTFTSVVIYDTYATYNDSTTFWIGLIMVFVSLIGTFLVWTFKEV